MAYAHFGGKARCMRPASGIRMSPIQLLRESLALVAVLVLLLMPRHALAYDYDATSRVLTLERGEAVAVADAVPSLGDSDLMARLTPFCDGGLFENTVARYVSYDADQGVLTGLSATGDQEVWLVDPRGPLALVRVVVTGPDGATGTESSPTQGMTAHVKSPGHWALANLCVVIASVSISADVLYQWLSRHSGGENPSKLRGALAIAPTVVMSVIFVLTQDFAGSMVAYDAWLAPTVLCLVIQLVYLHSIGIRFLGKKS